MSSVLIRWMLVFVLSLLATLGIYYTMNFSYLDYSVTDKDQLVIHEGWREPGPIMNSDVSGEEAGLNKLGTHMEAFNQWVLAAAVLLPVFIAAYAVLLSKKALGRHPRKKGLLWLTVVVHTAVCVFFLVQWIRYADLINTTVHNVMFG
ncbi:hypothetical protein JF544_02475 [Halobacillus kuroshimensis]|uniref:Uncharacterized protein n=1 Tax=Halobacillus kuroshimensis TaxID=302481 RepID=A0ABS3DRX6_9BACI|nr:MULTISPECIES: hypothetical protein [Halobacillus]MBN8234089.1 hypothetical protein [Halobacillus kuroshimensis]